MNRFIPELLTDVNRSQSLVLIHTSGWLDYTDAQFAHDETLRCEMPLKTFEDTRVVAEF